MRVTARWKQNGPGFGIRKPRVRRVLPFSLCALGSLLIPEPTLEQPPGCYNIPTCKFKCKQSCLTPLPRPGKAVLLTAAQAQAGC